jgi:hypothetical protein
MCYNRCSSGNGQLQDEGNIIWNMTYVQLIELLHRFVSLFQNDNIPFFTLK